MFLKEQLNHINLIMMEFYQWRPTKKAMPLGGEGEDRKGGQAC